MKKALIILSLLVGSLAGQVPYFHKDHPNNRNYKEYNSYKPNEIEIKEWRSKRKNFVEKELEKLNNPLVSRVGPYEETDSNGRHTYVKKEFKPRFGVAEVPGPEFVDNGLYNIRKLIKVDQPLCIANGKHKGAVLTKLVIVYEKCKEGWLCYDAYWVFVKPPRRPVVTNRSLKGVYDAQIRAARARGATNIRISPIHGMPVGRPKPRPEMRGGNQSFISYLLDPFGAP